MTSRPDRRRREPAHPLVDVLSAAARGSFPIGGPVSVVPAPQHLAAAVIAFSGHTFVAADVAENDVLARLGEDPLTGPVLPGFLDWLADVSNGTPGNQDLVLVARGTGAPDPDVAPEPDWPSHERAAHGARLRREVSGWRYGGDRGIILLGRGLVDRWEMAYEVDAAAPPGTGRLLARAALGLVTPGEPVFAQVAPGHARSLRATLAAGYQPIGSEILFAKGSV